MVSYRFFGEKYVFDEILLIWHYAVAMHIYADKG